MPPSRPKRKAAADAGAKTKRAKGETDLCDGLKWSMEGDVLKGVCPLMKLTSDTLEGSDTVLGFDIDFTVIKTASGRKFATGSNDWEWWHECVPQSLKDAHKNGHRIVFFTNQAGIEKNNTTPEVIMKKCENIISSLEIPVLVFVCTGNNHFRKPSTYMWDHFVKYNNGGVKPDLSKCMYIGDAAGRAVGWSPGKPKDFSCSDRMFAANIGIDFKTPEEYFLKEKPAKFDWHSLDPAKYLQKNPPRKQSKNYHKKEQEVIVMVGRPASGKSTFRRKYLEPYGYVAVNRDTLGTMAKCVKVANTELDKGKSIVADNTNSSASARSDFINMAKARSIPCRCFVMKTEADVANHLNYVRQNQTDGQVRRIPDVAYNIYKKNYEEPTKSEGFSEIIYIDFIPEFDNERDKTLFMQWTTGGH